MGWLAGLKCRKHHQVLYYSWPTGYVLGTRATRTSWAHVQHEKAGNTCNTSKQGTRATWEAGHTCNTSKLGTRATRASWAHVQHEQAGHTCNMSKLGHSSLLSTASPAIRHPSIMKLSLETENKITGAPKNRALHFWVFILLSSSPQADWFWEG